MARFAALIRGITPATHARMPMAALRAAATAEGLGDVRTLLATGNVVFTADGTADRQEALLNGIVERFGLLVNPVVVRSAEDIAAVVAGNPFADAARERPSRLVAFFLVRPARETGWIADYGGPERLSLAGTTLYCDYPEGVSDSHLPPARIDRLLGVVTTFRNWNTVGKLDAALQAMAPEDDGRHPS